MGTFRKSSSTSHEFFDGRHRFEHWYRRNTVYFITAKVRDGFAAFDSHRAKETFFDRFEHWASQYEFYPWVARRY